MIRFKRKTGSSIDTAIGTEFLNVPLGEYIINSFCKTCGRIPRVPVF